MSGALPAWVAECEVPDCGQPVGYGLRVCLPHYRLPVEPTTLREAVRHLRGRLERHRELWPQPDAAGALSLHGTYDLAALQQVLDSYAGSES